MRHWLLIAYLVFSLLEIYGEMARHEWIILAIKPSLLILLALWFFLEVRPLLQRFPRFILAGLIFSAGGDSLLMLVDNGPKEAHFFLIGLGSFLLAQVSYLLAFSFYPQAGKGSLAQRPWRGWPFLLYLAGIIGMLWPGIPTPMKAPVVVYAGAIVGMALAAFNLRSLLLRETFLGLMAGILLFLLSDSLIAVNKFGKEMVAIPYPRLLIMATYLLGQYLIARNAAKAWGEASGLASSGSGG